RLARRVHAQRGAGVAVARVVTALAREDRLDGAAKHRLVENGRGLGLIVDRAACRQGAQDPEADPTPQHRAHANAIGLRTHVKSLSSLAVIRRQPGGYPPVTCRRRSQLASVAVRFAPSPRALDGVQYAR